MLGFGVFMGFKVKFHGAAASNLKVCFSQQPCRTHTIFLFEVAAFER